MRSWNTSRKLIATFSIPQLQQRYEISFNTLFLPPSSRCALAALWHCASCSMVIVIVSLNGNSENHLRPQQKSSFKWRKPMSRVFSQRLSRPTTAKAEADPDRPKSASFIRRSVGKPFRSPRASVSMDFNFGLFCSSRFFTGQFRISNRAVVLARCKCERLRRYQVIGCLSTAVTIAHPLAMMKLSFWDAANGQIQREELASESAISLVKLCVSRQLSFYRCTECVR